MQTKRMKSTYVFADLTFALYSNAKTVNLDYKN